MGMPALISGQPFDGKGATFSGHAEFTGLRDVAVINAIFDGGSFKFTDCQRIVFRSCKFQNVNTRCIDLYGTLPGFEVTNCSFANVSADSCIFCTNGNLIDAKFNDNSFSQITHGIHLSWGLPQQRNDVEIARNLFNGVQRFAIETQNGVQGLLIHNNFAADWQPNTSRMAFSCANGPSDNSSPASQAASYSKGVRIYDNFIDDPVRQGTADAYAATEGMGADIEIHHNLVRGTWGCAVLYGWTTPAWSFHDNIVAGSTDPTHPIKAEDHGVSPLAANVYGNQLLATYARPAVADVLSGRCPWQSTGSGAPVITPSTQPQQPAMAIADLVGKSVAIGVLMWTWTPISTPVHYAIRPTHALAGTSNTAEGDLPAGAWSIGVFNAPDEWQYDLVVTGTGGAVLGQSIGVQYLASLVPTAPAQPATLDLTEMTAAMKTLDAAWAKLNGGI